MVVTFDPKRAYAHFDADCLNEGDLLKSMNAPVWYAWVNPKNPEKPPNAGPSPEAALLMIIRDIQEHWKTT